MWLEDLIIKREEWSALIAAKEKRDRECTKTRTEWCWSYAGPITKESVAANIARLCGNVTPLHPVHPVHPVLLDAAAKCSKCGKRTRLSIQLEAEKMLREIVEKNKHTPSWCFAPTYAAQMQMSQDVINHAACSCPQEFNWWAHSIVDTKEMYERLQSRDSASDPHGPDAGDSIRPDGEVVGEGRVAGDVAFLPEMPPRP